MPETLATGLAGRLGCAVLAMRYPVNDDFAIALAGKLYDLLAAKGQPLPRAVGMTLRELAATPDAARYPALSVATPAVFGEVAADLRLAAPDRLGPLDYDTGQLKMAGFPPQAGPVRGADRGDGAGQLRPGRRERGPWRCCCTGCLAAGRPRARWSWPTGTSTRSTGSSGARPPTRGRRSTGR